MAWKAPADFGGMTFRGVAVVIDDMGFVDMRGYGPEIDALTAELPSHGFTQEDIPSAERSRKVISLPSRRADA